jgi:chitinase
MKLTSVIPLLTLSALSVVSAFQASANTNVAIYWGQNSAGGLNTQARLADYCESDATDIVLLSFLHVFFGTNGLPEMNFASACNDGTLFSGTGLLQCPTIAEDIKTCQSKGKKVILSLGGASGAYGFTSDSQAEEFAQTLWNLYGGGSSDIRPFGDSVIDGFDLDIEGGSTVGYVAFSKKLRELFNSDSSKDYYITAAPQCPMPDYFVNGVITQSEIDFVFVQFYNNYCGMQAWETNNANSNFNYQAWDSLIKSSPNPKGKIYLGVPASLSAAGSGYVGIDTVVEAANYLQSKYDSFGGVMMWDASQAWANVENGKNFAEGAKAGLLGSSSSNNGGNVDSSAGAQTSSAIQSTISSTLVTSTIQPTTLSSVIKTSSAADSSAAPTTTTVTTSVVEITSTLSDTLTITTSVPETSSSTAEVKTFTVESSSAPASSSKKVSSSSTPASTTSSKQAETTSSSVAKTTSEGQSSSAVVIESTDSEAQTTAAAQTSTEDSTTTPAPSTDNNNGEDVVTAVVTQRRNPSTFTVFTTRDRTVTKKLPGPAPTGKYKIIGQSHYSSLDTLGSLIYNLETAAPKLDRRRAQRYSNHHHALHQKREKVVTITSVKASPTASTCPVSGGSCETEGELKCISHGYARCSNGQWIVRSCSAGTVCKESGSDIFCDWAGSWVLSPSSCGGYVESNMVSKRSIPNDDSIFGGGVFVAKTPDDKSLTDEMYSLKISIQQINSTHFKGMLTTSTITNNPVGKTWQLSFVSSLNITSVERGDLSYDAKSKTYTVDSIHIEEPTSNMAVPIPFWGLV